MKKFTFIFFLSLSNFMFSQTTELQSKGNYVWQASDEAKIFKEKLQMSFVSANQGFPSFGTVLAGSGYSATQDGGVFQLYFPYSSQYGGVAPKVRMGKYNNEGWTDWNTFYTSANANNASTNWATKKLIADDLIESKGTLSLYSSSAGLGDVISLYGNRLGKTGNYGFGVESGALYNKSVASHRWYIAKNADKGVSAKMELSNERLLVKANVNVEGGKHLNVRHVNGRLSTSASVDNLYLNYNTGKNVWVGGTTKRSDLIIANSESRVGIGTTNPDAALMVNTSSSLISRFQNGTPSDLVSGVRVNSKNSSGAIRYLDIAVDAENDKVGFGLGVSSGSLPIGKTNLDVAQIVIDRVGGRVGIGTANPDSKLAVNGTIHAKEVKVDLVGWPDYVFTTTYTLPTLKEVENHIQEKGHLQNIPSAKEVAKNGIQLGEMNKKLLEKIEELTLYTIQQEKRIKKLETKNTELENQDKKIEALEKKLNALLSKK